MNIFVLSKNPILAAIYQCDKHVIKMTLETAQILCSAFQNGIAPYNRTHINHPCVVWARQSRGNYMWLIQHGLALAREYTYRYNKIHKSQNIIMWCNANQNNLKFEQLDQTSFVQAVPIQYKRLHPVRAYRSYYQAEKKQFAKWNKTRKEPYWWKKPI